MRLLRFDGGYIGVVGGDIRDETAVDPGRAFVGADQISLMRAFPVLVAWMRYSSVGRRRVLRYARSWLFTVAGDAAHGLANPRQGIQPRCRRYVQFIELSCFFSLS
jgi:hypothetical protein